MCCSMEIFELGLFILGPAVRMTTNTAFSAKFGEKRLDVLIRL